MGNTSQSVASGWIFN